MSLGAFPTSEALPNITLATPLADKTFLDVANYFQPQINGGFVLISAYLVFFMHAGFCMVRCWHCAIMLPQHPVLQVVYQNILQSGASMRILYVIPNAHRL